MIATKYAGTDFHILIFERKDVGIMLSLMEGSGFCESGRHRHLLLLQMMMIMTMMTITMMMMTTVMMMKMDNTLVAGRHWSLRGQCQVVARFPPSQTSDTLRVIMSIIIVFINDHHPHNYCLHR